MHGVVGGGAMNRLVGEGSTYRRPHCVHCQHMRVVLASAMLLAGVMDVQGKGAKVTYVGIFEVGVERGFEHYTAE